MVAGRLRQLKLLLWKNWLFTVRKWSTDFIVPLKLHACAHTHTHTHTHTHARARTHTHTHSLFHTHTHTHAHTNTHTHTHTRTHTRQIRSWKSTFLQLLAPCFFLLLVIGASYIPPSGNDTDPEVTRIGMLPKCEVCCSSLADMGWLARLTGVLITSCEYFAI